MADEETKDPEQSETNAAPPAEAPAAPAPPAKSSALPIILAIVIPVLLLGGAAGFLFMTKAGRTLIGLEKKEGAEKKVELPEHIAYYELPEMLVNIQSTAKRKPYLRLSIKLELHNPEDTKTLDLVKPRIIDAFQTYLRELRVEDLEGSSGSQRLKQELLKRVNAVSQPVKVYDVLFGSFVVQ
jgi:flagellar FliL protein